MLLQGVPILDMGRCILGIPKYRAELHTYNQVSITGAMHLVGDVDGSASAIGDGQRATLFRFEVPDGVVVLWVRPELVCIHGRHGLGQVSKCDEKCLRQSRWW